MKTELVIFDMDGLMFDTEAVSYECWAKVIEGMGLEPDVTLFSRSLGGHEAGIEQMYQDKYGPEADVHAIFRESEANFHRTIETEGVRVKKGLRELLGYLKEKGIRKAIGSSSPYCDIMRNLKSARIENDFDYIMSGDRVKHIKPHPEIFLSICEGLNIEPQHALVLEDSRNGIHAACAGNIPCILIPDLSPPDEAMIKKASKVAKSLLDVIDILEADGRAESLR